MEKTKDIGEVIITTLIVVLFVAMAGLIFSSISIGVLNNMDTLDTSETAKTYTITNTLEDTIHFSSILDESRCPLTIQTTNSNGQAISNSFDCTGDLQFNAINISGGNNSVVVSFT